MLIAHVDDRAGVGRRIAEQVAVLSSQPAMIG